MVFSPASLLSPILSVKAALWDEAVPEQRHLTVQLARNSAYFTAAVLVLRFFGDQLAL